MSDSNKTMTRWLDMSGHNLTLAVCDLGNMRLLAVTGTPSEIDINNLTEIGFSSAGDNLWVRKGDSVDLNELLGLFPDSRTVEINSTEFSSKFVIRQEVANNRQDKQNRDKKETERRLLLSELLSSSHRIGFNHVGQEVWSFDNDQRFCLQKETKGNFSILAENVEESKNINPGLFLRAVSPNAEAQASDGFVNSMSSGEVRRFNSLKRFVGVLYGDGTPVENNDERLLHVDSLIEESMVRWLARRNTRSSREIFHGAQKLQEARAYRNELSRNVNFNRLIPLPVSVAMQRMLGTDNELRSKKVFVSGWPSLGAFIAPTADLKIISHDETALLSAMTASRRQSSIIKLDESNLIEKPFATLFGHPSSLSESTLEYNGFRTNRIDWIDALKNLELRDPEGQTVMAFESPVGANEENEFKELHRLIAQSYSIEGMAHIKGTMGYNDGNWYICSVGRKRPEIEIDPPSIAMKINEISDYSDLWTWTSSIAVKRAEIGNYYNIPEEVVKESPDMQINKYQSSYKSLSELGDVTAMVPVNLEAATREAQDLLKVAHPDFDDWVCNKVGLTKNQAESVLSPEQIDATGMVLHAFERGRAALIGDQTGLGKGRSMAAVIRSAILEGKKVIFITEKTLGFGEIARDFVDIGAFNDLSPFVMNSGVDIKDDYLKLEEGETAPSLLVSSEREKTLQVMKSGKFPENANIVFMTYSQVNQIGEPKKEKKKRKEKAEVVVNDIVADEVITEANRIPDDLNNPDELFGFEADNNGLERVLNETADGNEPDVAQEVVIDGSEIVITEDTSEPDEGDEILPEGVSAKSWWIRHAIDENTLLVLDESHNAAGTKSNVGANIAAAVNKAGNVLFCSATWAKNSRTMEIYNKLFPRDFDSSNIEQIINRGGDDMHAILTCMLVRDGVMISRQHDLSNCEFRSAFDDKYSDRNKDYLGRLAPILSEMNYMSGDIGQRINSINRRTTQKLMDKFKENHIVVQSKMRKMGLRTVAFGSPLYQVTKLCVSSLLIDSTVEGWIKALEEGRKPMAFLENTIQGLMNDIQADGTGRMPDFKDLMHRVLNQLCKVTRSGRKKGEVVEIQNPFESSDEEKIADRIAAIMRANMSEFLLSDPDPNEIIPDDVDIEGNPLPQEEVSPWKTELYTSIIESANLIAEADGINLQDETNEKTVMLMYAMDEVRSLVDNLHLVRSDNVEVLRSFPDYLPPTPARSKRRIASMIDCLPPLPASAIDEIRERIEAEGLARFNRGEIDRPWVVGEITGRNLEVRNGEIVKRKKPNRFDVRNGFNNGSIDCLIINAAGATSVSLHAGARFADQRQRELWMLQQHSDIMKFIQAIGRIYRFDMVVGPIIVTPMLAMPAHERLLGMQNVKLRRLSANMQSSIEHPASMEDIADLMNKVGDSVVSSWCEDHPDILGLIGFKFSDLTNDGDEVEDKDNESRDNDYIAHRFLARLIMLPFELQITILEEIKILYKATLQELNDKGENVLETKIINGTVHVRESSIYRGHDTEGTGSVFHEPVFLQKVLIEHAQDPLRSQDVGERIDTGLAAYTMQKLNNLPAHLQSHRESFIRKSLVPGQTIEQALALGGSSANIIKRFDRLLESLPKCIPGMVININNEGIITKAVITDVTAPHGEEKESYFSNVIDKKKQRNQSEFMASNYSIKFAVPGKFQISESRLSALFNEPEFSFEGHLNEEICGLPIANEALIMEEFDQSLEGMRISTRLMLVGNDWAAMQAMLDHKIGFPVLYRDENNNLHRAIQITKRAEALDFLPVKMTGAESGTVMASELLQAGNVKLYGVRAVGGQKDMEKADGLVVVWSKKQKMMKVSLPFENDTKHGWIMRNEAIKAMMDQGAEEDSLTKKGLWKYKKMCMWVPPVEMKAVLKVFADNGVAFFAPSSSNKFIAEWKANKGIEETIVQDPEALNDNEDHPVINMAI